MGGDEKLGVPSHQMADVDQQSHQPGRGEGGLRLVQQV